MLYGGKKQFPAEMLQGETNEKYRVGSRIWKMLQWDRKCSSGIEVMIAPMS